MLELHNKRIFHSLDRFATMTNKGSTSIVGYIAMLMIA